GEQLTLTLILRDQERGSRPSILQVKGLNDLTGTLYDLSETSVGSWEPNYDSELWRRKRKIALFVQVTLQKDGEGLTSSAPTAVNVMEWTADETNKLQRR